MDMRARAARLPPDERRAAIIDATLALLLRHRSVVSTRQIAEAAGIAEGTIFRVFPDKDALMQAVTAKGFDPEPMLREVARIDRGLPLRARLVESVRLAQHRLDSVFGLVDALGLAPPRPTPGDGHREMTDRFIAAIVDLIGADADQLRVPAADLVHAIQMLTFSATHPYISDGRPLSAEQIVSILLDGLLREPSRRPPPPPRSIED